MFTKLAADITFSDIKAFCDEYNEGVRVEYKQEMTRHIPKIVSSFANTQGGIFIIGVETDNETNSVVAIDGISNPGGLEEQIIQSALTGIYPAVHPEVIICKVPDTDNVVVVVRVTESPQAPHAIQNSTRVYIRTGSITQPYELAEIDRIEYLLKRREDSQMVTQQICNRTDERIISLFTTDEPNITVIAHPVFPHRPIISTGDIYEFIKMAGSIPFNDCEASFGTRRVAGGVCFIGSTSNILYWELNEYGFVYHRQGLYREPGKDSNEQEGYLHYDAFVTIITKLIQNARLFYEKCGYLGEVKITVQLQQVFEEKLGFNRSSIGFDSIRRQQCLDSQVSASTQCLARDLVEREEWIEIVGKLVGQLFWAFNVDDSVEWRALLERFY